MINPLLVYSTTQGSIYMEVLEWLNKCLVGVVFNVTPHFEKGSDKLLALLPTAFFPSEGEIYVFDGDICPLDLG